MVTKLGVVGMLGVLLIMVSLVGGRVAPVRRARDVGVCGDADTSFLNPESILGTVKTQLSAFIPYDVYRMVAKYSMGDHIDWETWESYRIPEAQWKLALVEELEEVYDHFLETIERDSQPPIEPYQHWQLFRAPDNVNDLWLSEVSLASDDTVHTIDKVNIILNGGIFSEESNRFRQYSSGSENRRLQLLRTLSQALNEVPKYEKEVFGFIEMARNEGFQKSVTGDLEATLKTQVECSYDQLSTLNLTLYNTFMETIPKEKLINYILELVPEVFKVINSIEAEVNLKSLLAAVKNKLKATDFNVVTSKFMHAFLEERSLVLGVDIHQVFSRLDQVHHTLGEGWWKLSTGQWPEMQQFITKLVTKTVKSEKFWENLQNVYLEIVAKARQQYLEREQLLEEMIKTKMLPFFKEFLGYMQQARVKDSSLVKNLITRVEAVPLTSGLEAGLEWRASILSKHYLSCYTKFYGKPDFDQLSDMVKGNPVAAWLHSLVVADWPEDQEVPAGLPQFVQDFQEMVLLLFTSVLGSCSQPMGS